MLGDLSPEPLGFDSAADGDALADEWRRAENDPGSVTRLLIARGFTAGADGELHKRMQAEPES